MSACNLKSQHFQQPEGAPAFLRTPLPPQPPPTGATPPERKKRTDVSTCRSLAACQPPVRARCRRRRGAAPSRPETADNPPSLPPVPASHSSSRAGDSLTPYLSFQSLLLFLLLAPSDIFGWTRWTKGPLSLSLFWTFNHSHQPQQPPVVKRLTT